MKVLNYRNETESTFFLLFTEVERVAMQFGSQLVELGISSTFILHFAMIGIDLWFESLLQPKQKSQTR